MIAELANGGTNAADPFSNGGNWTNRRSQVNYASSTNDFYVYSRIASGTSADDLAATNQNCQGFHVAILSLRTALATLTTVDKTSSNATGNPTAPGPGYEIVLTITSDNPTAPTPNISPTANFTPLAIGSQTPRFTGGTPQPGNSLGYAWAQPVLAPGAVGSSTVTSTGITIPAKVLLSA